MIGKDRFRLRLVALGFALLLLTVLFSAAMGFPPPNVVWLSHPNKGVGSEEEANNYYTRIDAPQTFTQWKTAYGFSDQCTNDELGETCAAYYNAGDLGFGREMHCRRQGQDIACYVTNHGLGPGGLLDVAVSGAVQGQNPFRGPAVAMVYKKTLEGQPNDVSFFVYAPDSTRLNKLALDSSGEKYTPRLCLPCHGGTYNPSTHSVEGASFLPFDLSSFQYSTQTGYTRVEQEDEFRRLNQMVLDTNPTDLIKELIQGWYDGPGLPRTTQYDPYVANGYRDSDPELYDNIVKPYCRTCHIAQNIMLDAPTSLGAAKGNVFLEPGLLQNRIMPHAEKTFHNLWNSPAPAFLANRLGAIQVDRLEDDEGGLFCTAADDDCSLRGAILRANDPNAGSRAIITFAVDGTHTLMLAGEDDTANRGDLDLRKPLIILGNGAGRTIIDGGGIDRVLHIHNGADVLIQGVTLQGGKLDSRPGAGILNDGGKLTLNNSLVRDNQGFHWGSGIANQNNATTEINRSTIAGNYSAERGGGIYNIGSRLTVHNSTISGNTAGAGGGIYNDTHGILEIKQSTVTGNKVIFAGQTGGGLDNSSGDVMLVSNSIVAGNGISGHDGSLSPADCMNVALRDNWHFNLVGQYGESQGCPISTTTLTVAASIRSVLNPTLTALTTEGATPHHPLLVGSPAIDAIPYTPVGATDCRPPSYDQRNMARPLDGDLDGLFACDIGAYEYSAINRLTLSSAAQTEYFDGAAWQPAVAAWMPTIWPTSLQEGKWVWKSKLVTPDEALHGIEVTFRRRFTFPAGAQITRGILQVTADNEYEVSLNGEFLGGDADFSAFGTFAFQPRPGENELIIWAKNHADPFGRNDPHANPAGLTFAAWIDYTSSFNCADISEIAQAECRALVDLYTSTDGANWSNRGGWLVDDKPCTWERVVCEAGQVQALRLGENQLHGIIPASLGQLAALQELDLGFNELQGTIPPDLGNLGQLRLLNLSSNQLTGSLPTQFGMLGALQQLDLSGNQLSGNLPAELGMLTNLQVLQLAANQFSGPILSALGGLSNLRELGLSNNQLSGAIPPELGQLQRLNILHLGDNHLSGNIPTRLGELVQLHDLYLYGNQLSGAIPAELGNLANLGILYLYNNQLSGHIPEALCGLPLTPLNVDYNMLRSAADCINSKALNWPRTQTVPPTDVQATVISNTKVQLTWTPILYQTDGGHYELLQATSAGGPYTTAGQTSDKSVSSFTVSGPTPGATYYFVVRTFTPPHGDQQNALTSDASTEVSATTPNGNAPPVAHDQTLVTSQDQPATVILSADDANGNPLTYTVISDPVNGLLTGAPPNLTYQPNPGFHGADSFTFQASDGPANSNTATINITVESTNHAPLANGQTVTTVKEKAVAITLNASDADGDLLTYRIVAQPQHGTLGGLAPALTYTPAAGYVGSDSFSFLVNDGEADSNVAKVVIEIRAAPLVNTPPVAVDGALTTLQNQSQPITLGAVDAEQDPLSFRVLSGPAHGLLNGLPPNFIYTPLFWYSGSDGFTFLVNDGQADSKVATVQITVTPDVKHNGGIAGLFVYQGRPVPHAKVGIISHFTAGLSPDPVGVTAASTVSNTLELETDANGFFRHPGIPVGRYEIIASTPVSGTLVRTRAQIVVAPEQTTVLPLRLQRAPEAHRQLQLSGNITITAALSEHFVLSDTVALDPHLRLQHLLLVRCSAEQVRVEVALLVELGADDQTVTATGEARLGRGDTCASAGVEEQAAIQQSIPVQATTAIAIHLENSIAGGAHTAQITLSLHNGEQTLAAAAPMSLNRGGRLVTGDGTLDLLFQRRTTGVPVTVNYSRRALAEINAPSVGRRAVQAFALAAYADDGATVSEFSAPYTLTVNYSDGQLAGQGIDEAGLGLAYWNGETWVEILPCAGCQVDLVRNQVRVVLDHFSEFALVGDTPVAATSSRIYLPIIRR